MLAIAILMTIILFLRGLARLYECLKKGNVFWILFNMFLVIIFDSLMITGVWLLYCY